MKENVFVPYLVWAKRNANEVGHILRRNCFLKYVIQRNSEGRVGVTGRRWRRLEQLLDELKGKTGYWKLKEAALDRILWRTRFGKSYGPVTRKTTKWMNESMNELVPRLWQYKKLIRTPESRYIMYNFFFFVLSFIDRVSRYIHWKINQLGAQLFFSIFRQTPLHVSGVSIAHHQEVRRMDTTVGTYYSF